MSPGLKKRRVLRIAIWMLWFQVAGIAGASEKDPTAFIHANLIPMTRATFLPDQTVVVQGNRITAVGPSERTRIPPESTVIDCRNAFLMPGLADMHMHLRYGWRNNEWPVSPLKLYLANGVTTIRCFGPGGKTGRYGLAWREEIETGKLVGPRILTCGPQLRGHFRVPPEQIVIRQAYRRFDFIKIYSYVTRPEFHAIMSTAKRLNLYAAGHIPFQAGMEGVLVEGLDEIAHIEELLWEFAGIDRGRYFESEGEWMGYAIEAAFNRFAPLLHLTPREQEAKLDALVPAIVTRFKDKSIPVCTTLVIDELIIRKLFDPQGFLKRPENRYLPSDYLERFRNGKEKHQMQFKGGEAFAPFKYRVDRKLLTALKAIKIPLLLSTDAGSGTMGAVPGFSLHDELAILVENGFSPYDALAAGTVVASKIVERMTGRDDFGTIVSGKRADLLLLARNPLDDVANAREILGVMAAGRWYDLEAIAGMLEITSFKRAITQTEAER